MPSKKTSAVGFERMDIDKGNLMNTGLKAHFHRLKPPQQRFEDVVLGKGTEEKAVDIQLKEEDAPIEVEEDFSDVQRIQQRVFTGDKPEFIKMTGPDNFDDRVKRLGIYDKRMKHKDIDTALVKYWIDQLGGDKDLYFSSPVFQQSAQDIDREHKKHVNVKQKREFSETAESKDEKAPKKRKYKSALTAKVRRACSPLRLFWNCIKV